MSPERALGLLITEVGCYAVNVEVSNQWSNEQQRHLDTLQYQVFTNKNPDCCAPGLTICEAVNHARRAIADQKLEQEKKAGGE